MHKRTRALDISRAVKLRVYERDGGQCVLCGRPGVPNAHYISRAHGGLGIEENILTLCPECHDRYDHTDERREIKEELREYLESIYENFDEKKLIYRKD